MCGIVGFNHSNSAKLQSMMEVMKHRGPDDQGVYEEDTLSLGHVRLSILDLSASGHQPMIFENLVMVYNGEVYNFNEIRMELEENGYSFSSQSDSEVILKAYHFWGMEATKKFIGMFAIALYDKNNNKLFLIRDRVGVKPLYYYHNGDDFVFASELKSIHSYVDNLQISSNALNEYFQFGFISSTLSIYDQCYKLPAGHYGILNLNTNEFKLEEYWSILPFFKLPKFEKTETELIDELENILIDAFKYRMVSDVPVGVFLSGGIDSSIVAAILQKHYGNIHTFTIGFKEKKYNEAPYAKEVASFLKTKHTEKIIDAKEAQEILKRYVEVYDEPFADSSGIPTTIVSKLAKENGIKVVLSADGGDEVFCGYSRYWVTEHLGKKIFSVPYPIRKLAAKLLQSVYTGWIKNPKLQNKLTLLKEYLQYKNWEDVYAATTNIFKKEDIISLMGTYNKVHCESFSVGENESPMQGMMLWDYHRYMVDDILTKVDRATMSVSIEGREPLLDHRIAEFMAQVPFKYKYKDGESKYLLKKVLERYIPREMIERPKKGFSIPMSKWFGDELGTLFDENFKSDKLAAHGLLNEVFIHEEYQKFLNDPTLNVNKLWTILVFQLWHNRYKHNITQGNTDES